MDENINENMMATLDAEFEGYMLSNDCSYVLNFSPGPAQFPRQIIHEIRDDLHKTNLGITAFEISHRSPEFNSILERVYSNLRILMKIPDDFAIIWTQGGGHGQFSAIPLNLAGLFNKENKGNYIVTGTWSSRAYNESKKFLDARNSYKPCFECENPIQYATLEESQININEKDVYVYLCSNETVNGLEFRNDGIPYPNRQQLKGAISVVDMSSDFTMKNVLWENIDIAFACTSKNLGIAGANVTIIRKDILKKLRTIGASIPCILDWNLYHDANSLYNTPAIYNIYVIDKFLTYYLNKGGIDVLENESKTKSKLVYDMLDKSNLYRPIVSDIKVRSNINIPFVVGEGDAKTRSKFLHYCHMNHIVGLRTKTPFKYEDLNLIEPLRISLYNGVTIQDTTRLVETMTKFEKLWM